MIETLSNCRNTHAESRGFFEGKIVWDLDLNVSFCYNIVSEGTILVLDFVSPVNKAADSVAFLEAVGYFASNFFDNARVVTSNLVEDQISFRLWDHCLISSRRLTLSPPLVK